MAVELTAFAFIAAALVLVPAPWFWRTRNFAILFLIVWLFALNLIAAINAVIWAGNTRPISVVWCDIATKLIIGGYVGIPACCLCTSIHLERLSSFRHARPTAYRTRCRTAFDVFMCWGFPLIYMTLHYIVQGHRFDIYEDMGCYPTWHWSPPSVVLIYLVPLVVSVASFIFSVLALIHFTRHRAATMKYLTNRSSALTTARFIRLLALVFVQLMWSLLLVLSLLLWLTLRMGRLRSWTSWDDVHRYFSIIPVYLRAAQSPSVLRWQYLIRLLLPLSAFSVFLFFSFNREVTKEYRRAGAWLGRVVRDPMSSRWRSSVGAETGLSSARTTTVQIQGVKELKEPVSPKVDSPVSEVESWPGGRPPRLMSPTFSRTDSFYGGSLMSRDWFPSRPPSVYTVDVLVERVAESVPPPGRKPASGEIVRPRPRGSGKSTSSSSQNKVSQNVSVHSRGTSGYAADREESSSLLRAPSNPGSAYTVDIHLEPVVQLSNGADSPWEPAAVAADTVAQIEKSGKEKRRRRKRAMMKERPSLGTVSYTSVMAAPADSPRMMEDFGPRIALPLRPPSAYTVDVRLEQSVQKMSPGEVIERYMPPPRSFAR